MMKGCVKMGPIDKSKLNKESGGTCWEGVTGNKFALGNLRSGCSRPTGN